MYDIVYKIVGTMEKIDFRLGRIKSATVFAQARKPAYKLEIDFGPELGLLQSSAQLTFGYNDPNLLVNRLAMGIVNFPPRSIAGFQSQVLVTGFYADDRCVLLCQPDNNVESERLPLGSRVGQLMEQGPHFAEFPSKLPPTDIETFLACNVVIGEVKEGGSRVDVGGVKGVILTSQKIDPNQEGKRIVVLIKEEKLAIPLIIRAENGNFCMLTCDQAERLSLGQRLA